MPNYPVPPVTFVRGRGSRLYDAAGKGYLDFVGGLAVTSVGHCHPAVAEAVATQAGTLMHVSNLYGTTVGPEVAVTLDRLLGGGGKVFFANSGAEANECAFKLARRWAGPGRHGVVSAVNSFHGRTLAALAATGQPAKQDPFRPLPDGFVHVTYGDVGALAEAIDPAVVGAVILEPIQGEGGVNVPPDGYLAAARRLCDERGVLLVVDEVQTGLGRTGRWFGFEHDLGRPDPARPDPARPDIVTMAKALGNGMPIGACWARAEVADAFRPGDHGTTLGGQPLAAAAARAVLAVMEAEDVPARAYHAGEVLAAGLAAIPGVASVRGRGLLLAAELGVDGSRPVAAAALERGLLVNPVTPSALRLAPSLLVTDDEIEEALAILAAVIPAVEARPS